MSRQQFRRYIRRFGRVEQGVMRALGDAPYGATPEQIAIQVWGDDEDEWPDNWRWCLRNAVHRLRRKQIPIENESIYYLS